jgi:hypothetical protein
MLPQEILKSRASKMPFPAFWGEIQNLMERVRDEEKINETTPSLMTILINIINVTFTENLI